MPVRSLSVLALAVALLAACGSSPPAASSSPPLSRPSPTAAADATGMPLASAAPTASPAPASATPAPISPIVNADGSVWIRPPAFFDFAQPGDGAVWGILQESGVGREIVRIDPATNEIEVVVSGLPILPNPVSPVAANGFIWLGSWDKNSVTQYDAETGEMIREIDVGLRPIEPVVAYGDVWAINHNGDSLTRINVQTGEPYPPLDLPDSLPLWITPVSDDLMLAGGPGPTVYLVDPQRMKVTGSYEATEHFEQRANVRGAVIDGLQWLKRSNLDEIAIVDPRTGEVLDSFESEAIPYPPLIVDGNIWLPSVGDNSNVGKFQLVGLDPETHEVVGQYEQPSDINEGSVFADFDSWWRWGDGGLLRVPSDTLREALR